MEDREYNIPRKLIMAIKSLYEEPINTIRGERENQVWFRTMTGVRQGSVLSPLLFILFLDKCLKRIGIRQDRDHTLVYADDAAIITPSVENLQEVLGRCDEVLRGMGMRMNKEKTVVMVISREREEMEVNIEETRLKQVKKFNYLGVIIDEQGRLDEELKERIKKFTGNVSMLYPLLKERGIPREVKVLMYKTILRPILLYGSECWALNTIQKNKLEAVEMRVLRIIKGVTLRDRLRSREIREDLNIEPIIEYAERNQLRWYGHLKRMDEGERLRRMLEWRPEGRRRAGRPRKRWMEAVSEAIESRGRTLAEVEEDRQYENRRGWREFWRTST